MKQRSYYTTLIFSNLLLLLVSFVIAFMGFQGYMRFSSDQADQYSDIILRQIRTTFDDKMSSINKLLLDISYNPQVSGLSFRDGLITEQDRYYSVQVINTLSSYVSVYSFLDSICLYYSESDRIISQTAAYSSTDFFIANSDCAYWSAEEWTSLFNSDYYREYRMTDDIFTIISPLLFTKDTYAVINIKASFMQELFENMRTSQSLTCVKEAQTNRTLFSLGDVSLEPYLEQESDTFQREDGTTYTIVSLDSIENDWVYYFILPENPFLEQAFDQLTLSLVVLLLIGGTIICFLLARQNAMPIRILANRISHQMQVDVPGGSEVELITKASTQAIDQYHHMKRLMDRYQPVLRSRLLQQLFQGTLSPTQLSPQDQKMAGICFSYPCFSIALLSLQQGASQQHLLSYMAGPQIMEFIQSKAPDGVEIFCAELSLDRLGILINSKEFVQENVYKKLRGILEYAYREFGIQITAAFAESSQDAESLEPAYSQCARALEKQLIRYPGEIIFSQPDDREIGVYYYPAEIEMRLLDSVKAGNIKNINSILDTVILENFVNNTLTLEGSRCLFFNLMGTVFKVIDAFGYRMEDILGSNSDCYQRILSCRNIQDMEALMREIFYQIC